MMHLLMLVIASVFIAVHPTVQTETESPTYYWRDFSGQVPEDAFQGGLDSYGRPMFIAQAVVQHMIIPAKVYVNNRWAYYEMAGREYATVDHVKILCTKHPEHFEWIKTDNNDIKSIDSKRLVIGGYHYNWSTLLGRIRHGAEVMVGKVLLTNRPHLSGLFLSHKGKLILYENYEVLTYNPKATGKQ